LKMALGFIPTKAPTQPKLRGAKIGPFKYGWVCAPEGAAHPLILDGLCLHVLSSFQRTEPCIALPCFRSATFQIYDSSYIAVNPKNRPVARFFTPLSSPKPVKRRRIRHRDLPDFRTVQALVDRGLAARGRRRHRLAMSTGGTRSGLPRI